ncbi:hypothetical protein G3M53_59365 [Streptomyces sp. SID7982]|nr:hypothetical protein [Streptomyces sp. SID7982]
MNDPHNPTATALELLLAIEGLAKQWEAEGKHDDARTVREKGPRFAADLSGLIATNPDEVIPALQEITAGMLADLQQKNASAE